MLCHYCDARRRPLSSVLGSICAMDLCHVPRTGPSGENRDRCRPARRIAELLDGRSSPGTRHDSAPDARDPLVNVSFWIRRFNEGGVSTPSATGSAPDG
jgi:hypothetical protein